MGQMTVRNIPDEQYAALKRVAAANNRSAEAEVRVAIALLVNTQLGEGFGSKLKAKYSGVLDDDFQFEHAQTQSKPMVFD